MTSVKLSSKNQIVIPKEVRQRLKLKAGSKINIYPTSENQAILTKKTVDPVEALEGLGADIWKSLGGTDAYIKRERSSWGDR